MKQLSNQNFRAELLVSSKPFLVFFIEESFLDKVYYDYIFDKNKEALLLSESIASVYDKWLTVGICKVIHDNKYTYDQRERPWIPYWASLYKNGEFIDRVKTEASKIIAMLIRYEIIPEETKKCCITCGTNESLIECSPGSAEIDVGGIRDGISNVRRADKESLEKVKRIVQNPYIVFSVSKHSRSWNKKGGWGSSYWYNVRPSNNLMLCSRCVHRTALKVICMRSLLFLPLIGMFVLFIKLAHYLYIGPPPALNPGDKPGRELLFFFSCAAVLASGLAATYLGLALIVDLGDWATGKKTPIANLACRAIILGWSRALWSSESNFTDL